MKAPGRWPGPGRPRAKQRGPVSRKDLERMVAEAVVDCYDEGEAHEGICTLLEDELQVPFATTVLGAKVTVERLERNDANEPVALCVRGKDRLRVSLLDLPLPTPRPRGWEWIEAYRHWAKGR